MSSYEEIREQAEEQGISLLVERKYGRRGYSIRAHRPGAAELTQARAVTDIVMEMERWVIGEYAGPDDNPRLT